MAFLSLPICPAAKVAIFTLVKTAFCVDAACQEAFFLVYFLYRDYIKLPILEEDDHARRAYSPHPAI